MKKQQRRPAAAAAFSVNAITNDESYTITLQIPRHVNFPIIGPTSIEFVGIGASAATTTLFVWMITILLFRQKPAKKVSSPKAKEESPPATPSVGGFRSENVTAKHTRRPTGRLKKIWTTRETRDPFFGSDVTPILLRSVKRSENVCDLLRPPQLGLLDCLLLCSRRNAVD